ncbi:purple acid phosphatase family protein [Flaviflexus massiliensis]|uniref:purple acid phosphatase family protein n=1 Tax=Flaviflexus massiliensis TaxID=1522309 RepID=UPI0006D52E62|nr:metallophosphoesterase family protein [Flaviflexus massiliensis]
MNKKLAALTAAMTAGLIAVTGPAALGEPAEAKPSLESPALSSTNDNPTVVDGRTVPTEVRDGFRVLPYLQRAGSTEMTVNWFSETGGTSPITVHGPGLPAEGLTLEVEGVHNPVNTYQAGELTLKDLNKNNAKGSVPQGTWIRGEKPYKHSARITNLVPNSDYTYSVNEDGYVHEASFSTFPEAGSDLTEPIHIIAFSDTETDPVGRVTFREWVETTTLAEGSEPRPGADSVWAQKYGTSTRDGKLAVNYPVTEDDAQRLNNMIIEEQDPDMIILAGDLTERSSWQTHWDEWFRYFAGDQGQVLDSIPIFTSPGNHEVYGYCASADDCTPVMRARAAYNWSIDTHGSTNEHALDAYHRTDYGPVTFISIDSTNGTDQVPGDPAPISGNDANITDEQLGTDTQNAFTIEQYQRDFPKAVEMGWFPGVEADDPIDQPNFMPGSEQYIWLEEQLKDARAQGQTIVLQWHHVAYSNGTHGTTMNHTTDTDAQPGTPMRHLQPLLEEYDVAAVFSGHDEMFQSSYVDQAGDGTGVYHWDVGVASDGLRGDKLTLNDEGERVPLLFNTHSTWMAQADEPEMWETNENGVTHLVSGGKHYGHLDIKIQPYEGNPLTTGEMPAAEMVMTPVSMFPILDDNYDLVDVERREMLSGQQSVYLDANGSPMAGEIGEAPVDPDPEPEPEPTPTPDPIPTGNAFALSNSWDSTTHDVAFAYGRIGDEVLVGDWDGNGTDTLAVRRGNTFFVNNELKGGNATTSFNYGRKGDEVLVGDWNGDGKDTFAVRRGTTFFVNNELKGGNATTSFNYGRKGDEVLVGDWNGDGKDTFAVRRGTTFFVNNELKGGNASTKYNYGRIGDEAFAGDFDGDGTDTVSLRRGNKFHVNNSLRGGNADSVLAYGRASDILFIGDWDGNGTDTPGVNRPN